MTTRDAVNARKKPVRKTIQGVGDVLVRRLSAKESLELSQLPDKEYGWAVIAATILDPDDGKPLFASKEEVADTDMAVVSQCRRFYTETHLGTPAAAAKKSRARRR